MASSVFNVAKGKIAYYASLPGATDALVMIPIEADGVEDDSVIVDYDTVADVLASNTEQTTMGRKTLTGVTVSVNDADDRVDISSDDVIWSAATGDPVSDLLLAYDPDGSGNESQMVPLAWYDFGVTPDGSDIIAAVTDLMRAT